MNIYVITADTFGSVEKELENINCKISLITEKNQDIQKSNLIHKLGHQNTIAIGNGRNDKLMLETSVLGISVLGNEGVFTRTLLSSDIIVKDINDALDLLLNLSKLKATLRN